MIPTMTPPPPAGGPPVNAPWPHGAARPAVVSAAGVVGASAAVEACLAAAVLAGHGTAGRWAAAGAVGVAILVVVGSCRVLTQRGEAGLRTGAVATVVVALVATWVGGVLQTDSPISWAGSLFWVLPVPLLVVVLVSTARVRGWARAERPAGVLPYWPPPAGWVGSWPWGGPRPGAAQGAAVTSIAAGGLTLVADGGFVLGVAADGSMDAFTVVVSGGLVVAPVAIVGGVLLFQRRTRRVAVGAAVANLLVLLVATIAALSPPELGVEGPLLFVVLAAPLPVATLLTGCRRDVVHWLDGRESWPVP